MTQTLKKLLLALTIGGIGGWIAHRFDLPLAWMIGAMGATLLAGLYRVPVQVPMKFRAVFLGILGAYLGSSFTTQTLERAQDWPLSLTGVALFVCLTTTALALYYRKVAGLDPITALFSSAPGGLTPMTVIGGANGGQEHQIALTQGIRAVLVVFLTPTLVFGILGYEETSRPATPVAFQLDHGLILLLATLIGIALARVLKMPAAPLTGAMFSSAFVHMNGWVVSGLPDGLLGVTLWVLGSAIGSRFYAIPIRSLFKLSLQAIGAVFVLLALTLVCAYALSQGLGLAFLPVLLALAPGGVAEMCLIAVALHIDPAFVALHHLIRISLILLPGPFIGRLVRKYSGKTEQPL